ncbi:MAG: ABC transporter substrate-binding protein [Abyssibacter sp.]|uniref:ABC transporter substrate-binding protein n=1 Tax=Abyssibacter sp. TaxID=2320200 RepID=UPI003219E284
MRNRTPRLLSAAAASIVVATLAACGGGQPRTNADGTPMKVYRHSMDGAPVNLDPVQSAVIYSNFVVLNTYDTLYSYKYLARPYELKPNLAKALPEVSEDGLTYTIRLKEGSGFIDDPAFADGKGREVIAQDFVYSIKRHFDPKNRSQGAWLWQGKIVGLDQWKDDGADYGAEIEGLKALDDHTIQIKLVKPFPQLTYTLAMGFAALVPHEAVEAYGRELSVRPVGSGPFKLERFSTAKAVFVPNPNYRQEPVNLAAEGYDPALHAEYGLEAIDGKAPPFVDRLEIDFITETASRWASFTSDKEVQYSHVPVEQVDSVLASKQPLELKPEWSERYHSAHGTEAGFVYTYFNMDRPALGTSDDPAQNAKNKALRCAMVDAFSWAERNARFYSGIGNVFPGVITPVVPEFDPETPRGSVTQDMAAAKQALEDAGWTPETLPEIIYGHVASVTNRQMFEQFRGFMAELGFPVDKVRGESYATFGDFNKGIKTNQFDVGGLGWGLDYPDAENTLQLFYGPNRTPGSNNANYSNPEFDALYEQTAVMQPGPERTAIYRQMNQMVIDDCVALTGLSRTRIYLWHKDVIGVPDREILGGFWLKYVDVKTDGQE